MKHPMWGKTRSKACKRKISRAKKKWHAENEHPFEGCRHTDEDREQISEAVRAWYAENEHPFEGQEHTEESKRKMSRSLKAHYAENDVWNKGVSPSEETRRRISASLRGRSFSEEHKTQLSKASSGENNPDAKLTEERVREIHRIWNTGGHSQSEIGRKFNVTQANVSSIVNGKTWSSVYEEFNASDAAE